MKRLLLVFSYVFFLCSLLFLVGCTVDYPSHDLTNQQTVNKQISVDEINKTCLNSGNLDFWNCFCAKLDTETVCKQYSDCEWTNFHSMQFYCMETVCMNYDKTECKKHSRCVWLYDKNTNKEYCEGVQYFDESRHALINYS